MPHPRYKLWEEKWDQVTELLTKALLGQPIGHGKMYGQGHTPHIGHEHTLTDFFSELPILIEIIQDGEENRPDISRNYRTICQDIFLAGTLLSPSSSSITAGG